MNSSTQAFYISPGLGKLVTQTIILTLDPNTAVLLKIASKVVIS